jgi:hypothetical protein
MLFLLADIPITHSNHPAHFIPHLLKQMAVAFTMTELIGITHSEDREHLLQRNQSLQTFLSLQAAAELQQHLVVVEQVESYMQHRNH